MQDIEVQEAVLVSCRVNRSEENGFMAWVWDVKTFSYKQGRQVD